jgi:beta-glucanase (GH16 family)
MRKTDGIKKLPLCVSLALFVPVIAWGQSFFDDFKELGRQWIVTSTGKLGASQWTADHVLARKGTLVLRHTLEGGARGAELHYQNRVQYGRLSARIKAGKAGGVLSTLFFYGEYAGKVHEIDVELFPDQADAPNFTSYMDWQEKDDYVPGPHYYHLQPKIPGFDCREWHVYTIDWLKDRVVWYVDGKKWAETKEIVPFQPTEIMMNSWYPNTWAKAKPDQDSEEWVDWIRWKELPKK